MLKTTPDAGKVGLICSLIAFADETAITASLTARSDLDMLVALHCQRIPRQQNVNLAILTNELKAQQLWRALRFPSGYDAPWDWNWQPPLSGNPYEIAAEFHAAVSRAVFRIPLLDFVKYALGYDTKALFVKSLFDATRDVCDSLQRAFRDHPTAREIYNDVEQVSGQKICKGKLLTRSRYYNRSIIH
jgi:hypothetical protein